MIDLVEAYILLNTETGRWRSATEAIQELNGIKKIERITGDYDIVILAEAPDISTLTETIVEKIHKIEGVTDSTTSIIVG